MAHDGRRSVSAPLTGGNLATLGQLQAGQDLQFSFPQGYVSDGRNVYSSPKIFQCRCMWSANEIIVLR